MKRTFVVITSIIVLAFAAKPFVSQRSLGQGNQGTDAAKHMIKITSPEFSDSGSIPIKFTCNGGNINPALSISDVLAQTKSLAIVMEDPDAPGGTWNHWLIWNIDPSTSEIGENSVPPGSIQGANSSGKIGYQGPCPPSGTHRYYFKVYALDNKPELPQGATREDFESAIAGHILDEGQLMGKFQAPENR